MCIVYHISFGSGSPFDGLPQKMPQEIISKEIGVDCSAGEVLAWK